MDDNYSKSQLPPNHSEYDWKLVRPDPDQRASGEVYSSEIKLKPIFNVFLPPYTRTIISVKNSNKLPENIYGFIHQTQAWQEDNINLENFYIEKSSPDRIKITLSNTSTTSTLRLTGGLSYGNLVIRRFRKYDDRFFQKLKDKFTTNVIDKGKIFLIF